MNIITNILDSNFPKISNSYLQLHTIQYYVVNDSKEFF